MIPITTVQKHQIANVLKRCQDKIDRKTAAGFRTERDRARFNQWLKVWNTVAPGEDWREWVRAWGKKSG